MILVITETVPPPPVEETEPDPVPVKYLTDPLVRVEDKRHFYLPHLTETTIRAPRAIPAAKLHDPVVAAAEPDYGEILIDYDDPVEPKDVPEYETGPNPVGERGHPRRVQVIVADRPTIEPLREGTAPSQQVPEPGSGILLLASAAALLIRRRR